MYQMTEVTDLSAPELDPYVGLSEKRLLHYYEPEPGLFLAESLRVIDRALDAGYRPISVLAEHSMITEEAREIFARCGDISVYCTDPDTLRQVIGYKVTRGMLCAMVRRPLPSVGEVCAKAKRVVILENVTNPTNVGAIFRSAAALNMDAVLLTNGCSDPLYRRSVRVSMGTVFQIPWTWFDADRAQREETDADHRAPCPRAGLNLLHQLGFQTVSMALREESLRVDDAYLRGIKKLAVVLGTENEGLAESTLTQCDYTVRIPMSHGVDSLNVAAAAAVAFWEFGKQRE